MTDRLTPQPELLKALREAQTALQPLAIEASKAFGNLATGEVDVKTLVKNPHLPEDRFNGVAQAYTCAQFLRSLYTHIRRFNYGDELGSDGYMDTVITLRDMQKIASDPNASIVVACGNRTIHELFENHAQALQDVAAYAYTLCPQSFKAKHKPPALFTAPTTSVSSLSL